MLLISITAASAQQSVPYSEQKSLMGIEVHFRFDNAQLDLGYMGNAQSLDRFAHIIDSIGLYKIDSVVIVSQSSPEGVYEHNLKLSRQRAATMRGAIEQRHPELSDRLRVHPDGESWQRLREYVKNDTKMKQTTIDKVISIIDSDVNIGTKKWRMEQLPIYRYLRTTYYPRIRNSVFCTIYYDISSPEEAVVAIPERTADIVITDAHPTLPTMQPTYRVGRDKATVAALKSNLLYDVTSALNTEVEIPIGKQWSVMASYLFPWWAKGNKYAFQILELGFEGRYWFARNWERDVLAGHFGGVYLKSGLYDLQWDHALCYQGEHWSAGLTYGYAMPIGRWLNLELSASIGYMSTHYRHYRPSDDYSHLLIDHKKQGHLQYIGPTQLKASLVLPIQLSVKKRKEVVYAY